MENKEKAQQKKVWITPELFNESIKETESKERFSPYEDISSSTGPS
jgi:hypothetical protein